jgi:hypothetical protein
MEQSLSLITLAVWGQAKRAEDAAVPDGASFSGVALAHNAGTREEVDAILEEGAGGRILRPARATAWGGYAGYFANPDDHPWKVSPGIPTSPCARTGVSSFLTDHRPSAWPASIRAGDADHAARLDAPPGARRRAPRDGAERSGGHR